MVTTTSAARTTSSVSGFGNASVSGMPTSPSAVVMTSGIVPVGLLPADRTEILPKAWCCNNAAAICDRPTLCTQMKSTWGTVA